MKIHNISNESQVQMNEEISAEQTQNIQLYLHTSTSKLKNNKNHSPNQNNQEKPSEQIIPPKETKIPENMKTFLKQKRLTSQFMQGEQKPQNRIFQKPEKRSQISPIKKRNSKQKKIEIDTRKTIKSLEQTAQSLNQEDSSRSELICKICEGKIDSKMLKQKQKVFDCGHAFCEECTKSYVEYKIRTFEQIYCPNQNCKGSLNEKSPFYCSQISLKERKQYIKIHRFFQIHKSTEAKRLCPQNECQGIITLDLDLPMNKCSVCGFEICTKCLNQVHSGECEDYETKFLKQNFNLVKCEKCKNFIQKSEGCHHISCKCGYEFCQKCKLAWTKRHICKYTGLSRAQQGWGGCDWGITTRDHIKFLLKLPMKFFLIVLLAVAWTVFSFLGAPLNIVLLIYWFYLLLVKPSVEKIRREENCWKILAFAVFFPFFMLVNLCDGYEFLINHIDQLMPQISNSFRWVIRL